MGKISAYLPTQATEAPFVLAGCQSKKAKEVEEKISVIGEVTLDSENAITEAEMAFEALSEGDAKKVENSEVLQQAREKYDSLVKENERIRGLAEDVDNAIAAIGTVTVDSKNDIESARKKYAQLSQEAKQYVQNEKLLEEAEQTLEALRVEEVENLIASIGEVTVEKKSEIEEARKKYNILTSKEKGLVSNSDALSTAEDTYKKLKIDAANALLASFKKSEDKVQNVTFYYPSGWSWYDSDTWAADKRCFILPYLAKRGDDLYLYYVVNYTGKDWVFFDNIIVAVGDERYTEDFGYNEVVRNVGWGKVWEYARGSGSSNIKMLRAIADSSEAIVRFQGDNYRHDLTVTDTDKKAIRQALEVYDAFNDL